MNKWSSLVETAVTGTTTTASRQLQDSEIQGGIGIPQFLFPGTTMVATSVKKNSYRILCVFFCVYLIFVPDCLLDDSQFVSLRWSHRGAVLDTARSSLRTNWYHR